ncbi:MAG: aminotransferase class I/II-fold pyridoxal phosphate-dependent enzyme [Saprospiraceae bacterium]|nr:aminotransferase class I/II-fold pyridoxal phosphate-dependent enzyme [Saprospiraceae bacterium]
MLERNDYGHLSTIISNWIERYFNTLEERPVKSRVQPGEIYDAISGKIPDSGEAMETIIHDLEEIIMPGMTHWQHPNFHAYFPANSSVESVLAEQITAAMGAQCMVWETSPAATELEQRMLEWLRDAMGLPKDWQGVLQDTASSATLVAMITAREVVTGHTANDLGVPQNLRVYCTDQTHSSIVKSAGIAGIGRRNVVEITTNDQYGMDASDLAAKIKRDRQQGLRPCCVVATLGTTGIMAFDDLKQVGKVCLEEDVWLHVDAAYTGTALLLPEYRWMSEGMAAADSFVFNPHKWMFTNFDCTAYYIRDVDVLLRTFEILPEYLRTSTRGLVNDYRDWGIALGRRFRALKLWFVMRSYGLTGLQSKLRKHIQLNHYFAEELSQLDDFEILFGPILNFAAFRLHPGNHSHSARSLNTLNQQFLHLLNQSGEAFLSHTVANETYVIRVVFGQTYLEQSHVDHLLSVLSRYADNLLAGEWGK